jgi:hypothetical protein
MKGWRSRLIAFTFAFKLSLIAVFIYSLIVGLFWPKAQNTKAPAPPMQGQCATATYFASPEAILSALKDGDVEVRRDMFRRLFLRPGITTVYYDYERDREYPERAMDARLQYVHLDDYRAPYVVSVPDAVLTFVRADRPVALVLQREACGWRLCAALSAWLRFEDYPYQNWLEVPELVKPGTHELLLHESTGDASTYVRKACVLKLINGALVPVAEFNEEEIKPVANYRGADWSDVKQRTTTHYSVVSVTDNSAPQLRLDTKSELIKYNGEAPEYTYWLETDGAWHALTKHWRTRPSVRLKQLSEYTERLIWDGQRQRFVAAQD